MPDPLTKTSSGPKPAGKFARILSAASAIWQRGTSASRPTRLPGVTSTTACTTYHTPAYEPSLVYTPWLSADPSHVRHAAHARSLAARPRVGLWWLVYTPAALSDRKVVRSFAARRVRAAFEAALAREGFDARGVRRDGGVALTGSAKLVVRSAKVGNGDGEMSEVLRREMEETVAALCRHAGVQRVNLTRPVGGSREARSMEAVEGVRGNVARVSHHANMAGREQGKVASRR